jgi:hypothetical protein
LKPLALPFAVLAALLPMASPVQAESGLDQAQFFVSQRLWRSDWDVTAVDMRLIPSNGTQPPLLTDVGPAHVRASRTMPLTGFGVALDRWTLSATVGWSTKYSDARLDAPAARSEYDINLGYAVTPNLSAVVLYKAGKADVPAVVSGVNPIALRDEQRLRGGGLGFSARYPFAENWSAYGSAAYGSGRSKLARSNERLRARYTVAEAGVGYRLPGAWANASLTAGYRYQEVDFRDGPQYTFALTPEPTVVGRSGHRVQSAAKGFTAGVAYSF